MESDSGDRYESGWLVQSTEDESDAFFDSNGSPQEREDSDVEDELQQVGTGLEATPKSGKRRREDGGSLGSNTSLVRQLFGANQGKNGEPIAKRKQTPTRARVKPGEEHGSLTHFRPIRPQRSDLKLGWTGNSSSASHWNQWAN